MANDKKYCTLQECTYWIAFGTTTPPAQAILEQEQALNKAKANLFTVLVAGLITPTGIQMELKPTEYLPKYFKTERKRFKVYHSNYLDIARNNVFDAYIDESKHLKCNLFKYMTEIEIDFNELKKHFPPKQDDINTKARPEQRQLHDIVYYFWQRHNNLSAEQLHNALNEVINDYFPGLSKNEEAVKLSTMQKWRTDFKNNKYTPATKKSTLTQLYPGILSKLTKHINYYSKLRI